MLQNYVSLLSLVRQQMETVGHANDTDSVGSGNGTESAGEAETTGGDVHLELLETVLREVIGNFHDMVSTLVVVTSKQWLDAADMYV